MTIDDRLVLPRLTVTALNARSLMTGMTKTHRHRTQTFKRVVHKLRRLAAANPFNHAKMRAKSDCAAARENHDIIYIYIRDTISNGIIPLWHEYLFRRAREVKKDNMASSKPPSHPLQYCSVLPLAYICNSDALSSAFPKHCLVLPKCACCKFLVKVAASP